MWKSDGTPGGTDIVPNAGTWPAGLTESGGTLYYSASGELWKLDAGGASLVEDINAGGSSWPSYQVPAGTAGPATRS